MKFHPYDHGKGKTGYIFQCPGCGSCHMVLTEGSNCPIWTVNGVKEDKPTVRPSIRVRGGDANGPTMCHSFVVDGKIQFLDDCTHELAGQTVEIPDFDD
jgi:hypothetical protein